MVTDNATNFGKAFRMYNSFDDTLAEAEEEIANVSDSDDEFDEPVILPDVPNALMQNDEADRIVSPPHLRCAAHTLNLVVAQDLAKAKLPNECRKILRSSLSKCYALCNKVQRSTKAADAFRECTGRGLVVPTVTILNSLYSSLLCIANVSGCASFDSLMDRLKL